ncbi:MAG: DUF2764 family protein [Methylococcaceae bacterium]|nr:DUF2764 family protein [Methylococcaceae bacterium]MDP3903080.1 DUF2764 family protein [Methylococcaceae bacterium]
MAEQYITLVTSLPYLPPFEKAERSPITRLRLEQRLHMLEPDDARQLVIAEALVSWRMSLSKPKSDQEMLLRCRAALQDISHPALREFVEFRLDQQTILAALRQRKHLNESSFLEQVNGGSRWARVISSNWDSPDFKLAAVYPWIPQARTYIEANDAGALDRLMMGIIWEQLSRIADSNRFGFEAVFAFVLKWDILQAWLARDAGKAKSRFQELIKEVTNVS